MSRFHGMFLFDIADEPIGDWEEDLGYRGVKDVWRTRDKHFMLVIEPNEDTEDEEEVWVANERTGNWDSIAFGTYEECIDEAKKFMRENPNGWTDEG